VADAHGEEMKYRMAATGGDAISDIYIASFQKWAGIAW
jgi:hypothetical protein